MNMLQNKTINKINDFFLFQYSLSLSEFLQKFVKIIILVAFSSDVEVKTNFKI